MNKRLALFDKLIADGSTDPFHHYGRALELRALGRHEEALEALVDVATRFPDYVPTYLIAGQLADQLERPDQARELLLRGVERARAAGDEHALSELKQQLDAL